METIKIGIAGFGRQGKVHANNIVNRVKGVTLEAVCSVVPSELDLARNEYGVKDVYADYDFMLKNADIDAVIIATSSDLHCLHAEKALNAGKHVFTEKPMGTNIAECLSVEKCVKAHPDKVFMVGYMRRYDPSYVYAKQKIEAGAIGKPYLVKATGIDPLSSIDTIVKMAKNSPGLFIGMGIHDVDLIHWFLGARAKQVYAVGTSIAYKEFAKYNDAETGCALYSMEDGTMGMLHTGRMAPHGYHIETEIVGTEGSIRISPVPAKNLAMIYDHNGATIECIEDFRSRFDLAFLNEIQEFVDCIREKRQPDMTVYDSTNSTRVVVATTQAFRENRLVTIEY